MAILKIGGQTLQEMSEQQLKNLLPEFKNKPEVYEEIMRLLQTKSRLRNGEARTAKQVSADFKKNGY